MIEKTIGDVGLYVAWLLGTKWILSCGTGYGFMFPICLGCCNIGVSMVSMSGIFAHGKAVSKQIELWERHWRAMLALGALLALDVLLQYSSLVNQSLTLNQIIRFVLPPTLLLSNEVQNGDYTT